MTAQRIPLEMIERASARDTLANIIQGKPCEHGGKTTLKGISSSSVASSIILIYKDSPFGEMLAHALQTALTRARVPAVNRNDLQLKHGYCRIEDDKFFEFHIDSQPMAALERSFTPERA